jgi:hypothetical protein
LDPKNEGVPLHFLGPKLDFCSENGGKIQNFTPKIGKIDPKIGEIGPKSSKKCPKSPSDGVKKGKNTPILVQNGGIFPYNL